MLLWVLVAVVLWVGIDLYLRSKEDTSED